jgi:hypothetical protein
MSSTPEPPLPSDTHRAAYNPQSTAVPPPASPSPSPERRYYPTTTQTLPPQTIAGVYVEGTRITRTTPAGYGGNDHDLTVTTETWRSPELGINLRTITDDPRTGRTTLDTTSLERTDPDPSLFLPPPGYTLKDTN